MLIMQSLNLDAMLQEILSEQGIDELYPPQKKALPMVLNGRDLVLAVPTAAGKSLVAYLAIVNKLLKEGGKALYIVPLRALAREKFEDLRAFKKTGLKVGVSTGDLAESSSYLSRYDMVVCTSEKADSLLRHGANWLSHVSILVVDEIHLLHDPSRGPTLEVVIARFKRMNPNIQVVALSATIQNADEIASWLNAELVTSDWRPVQLKEGVFYRDNIEFIDGTVKEVRTNKKDGVIPALVLDSISEGGQVLVFVNTRKSTVSLASKLSTFVEKTLSDDEKKLLQKNAEQILSSTQEVIPLSEKLAYCIGRGVAFHHAGLSSEQRRMVEDSFKQRMLKCIVATPTLAAGVNIPARRVIIRDLWRYDPNFGMQLIPVLEYKQQAGRAGRPRYDSYGEAVVIARNPEQKKRIIESYLLAEPEPIFSKLGMESALRIHLLSAIVSSFAFDRESIYSFMRSTFYAHQSDVGFLGDEIENVLSFLEEHGFIETFDGRFQATLFGSKTSSLYVDPVTALQLKRALENTMVREVSPFAFLQVVCATPDLRSVYLKQGDDWVEESVDRFKHTLLLPVPNAGDADYEWFLSDYKTAMLLEDWINEVPEAKISSRYGVGPGDIHVIVETAEWLLHAMRELARLYRFDVVPDLTNLILRVRHGCKKDLLNLISLKGVGRVRARALYNAGFTTISSLHGISVDRLARVPGIGVRVASSIKKQIGENIEGERYKKG
ncbi:MAG: DEAD/DEAH box helicase [Thermoplasmata archaeon]|nr:DEAD/DEAH box helicase [Thermoplasmata archaeon]